MSMFLLAPSALAAALVLAAAPVFSQSAPSTQAAQSALAQARSGHLTAIVRTGEREPAAPTPPKGLFDLVRYSSPAGKLAAYVTPNPADGQRHPAIVWITGGDCNSIGDMWSSKPRDNDQSAAAYRKAGIVMMVPSLRGGNDNPGRREGFYGEVDDVIAAADYLATLPWVDPDRIYLGGHSTGGTLTMLVAETSKRFRATFAFGPVEDPTTYGAWAVYHAPGNRKEAQLRAPIEWLAEVRAPLFVIEGFNGGNIDSMAAMQQANRNERIRFIPVQNKTHFSVLAPANELIASRIAAEPARPAETLLSFEDAARISSGK